MIEFLISNGWDPNLARAVALILGVVACSSFGLIWVIFGIWLERKVAGRIQDRLGPNRTGPFGLLQTFADIGKLLTKEDITPQGADRHVFNLAPVMAVAAVLLIWAVVPFSQELIGADLSIGVVYVAAVGGFATLSILLAGWGSNNKYALLGAFRVVAQLISYEVPMVLALLVPVMLSGSMSTQAVVNGQNIWYVFVVPITALIFLISSIAEVGRSPFDLLEAESEIIAGFNIEYSGMKFAMFYAAEFLHAFTICVLTAVLFLGGWRGPGADLGGIAGALLGFSYLFIKTMIVYFVIMLIRNTVPRLRIDHMMSFNWKFLVPLSMVNLLVIAVVGRIFAPDYGAAKMWFDAEVAAGGLRGLYASALGWGFAADFWRFVALLIANVLIFIGMQRVLRQYVTLDQRTTKDVANSRPVARGAVAANTGSVSSEAAAGR
ncbi:MAG: NADH-quinone oxidoreductase subunit NuoH [Anaerolineae bacterium]|nr:NADH-quinone oxidoreductase subunit NuoH [Anaerolineae bacterium]